MASNRYVHFFGFILLTILFSASLQAQMPSFSFVLDPIEPTVGDTAILDVSMDEEWSPSGEDDTLFIVYSYSGFQIDSASKWLLTDTATWLKEEIWTSEVEVVASAHELHIRLIFPATSVSGEAGLVFRIDGIIIIDDLALREGISSSPAISEDVHLFWQGQKLEVVAATIDEPIRELIVLNLRGQRLAYWRGSSAQVSLTLHDSRSLYFIRIRTDRRQYTRRLMRW